MKNFVISDLHLDHENIIKLADRPFKNLDEMQKTIIDNWNKVVSKEDTVYILGDFAKRNIDQYLKQLNGKKILIAGNHDPKNISKISKELGYEKVYNGIVEISLGDKNFVLSHYPINSWNGMYRNTIHLYGHIHSNSSAFELLPHTNAYCVNCEFIDYTPFDISKIKVLDFKKNRAFGNKVKDIL